MKVVATYSIKGGVGKTATAVNLAFLAARGGARTLVWDLDPQSAASYSLRVKSKVKGGIEALVRAALLPFFSMVDRRKKLHRETVDTLLVDRPEVLRTCIPYASDIEQQSVRRAPTCSFAPRSRAALAFDQLWAEAGARLA